MSHLNSQPELHLLDSKQTSEMLRCSERTVFTLRKNGELPFIKIGKTLVRFRKQDVEHYITSKLNNA